MEAYFDNAATTKPFDIVIDKMNQAYEDYANPSSLHLKGIEAEKHLREAKKIFSKILKIQEKEIFFTSGGTESNNLAIIGAALANQRTGKHIITTAIEHDSVSKTVEILGELGFDITILPVDKRGIIDINQLKEMITDNTILVSIMHINNEIGSIQPIGQIGKVIKEMNKNALFHVDAVQSFGKNEIYPQKSKIDMMSISSHKIHGPKGVGALYIRDKVKIKPIIHGGGHQQGIRSGTENVPGIASFALAAEEMNSNLINNTEHYKLLKKRLIAGILENIEEVQINGDDIENSASHILNIRFKKVRGEVLLHTLETKGIYISTGSACAANKSSVSQTLKSISNDPLVIEESVRFSFSINNTIKEIDYCIDILKKEVSKLRKYVRGGR